ncbi:GtrA family protein [Gorillibacterium timonense]|uniref:GtrA family protein n=1 Tax=Gorillibacterium timonense TaxID=1689269 RepID=UPI00071CB90C|nr:GtrA family protein [Gorillibacterium timonense]
MNRLQRLVKKFEDLLKFGIVGVANTFVDFAVYTILYYFGVPYRVAQCFSYAAGTLNSYILNKKWTFAAKAKDSDQSVQTGSTPGSGEAGSVRRIDYPQAIRFLIVNLISLGVSLVLLGFLKEQLGLHAIAAKLLVTVVTTLLNFVGSKLWVFRKPVSGAANKPGSSDGSLV